MYEVLTSRFGLRIQISGTFRKICKFWDYSSFELKLTFLIV